MTLDITGYDSLARKAIRSFWKSRSEARDRQIANGGVDRGERSAVTAGSNMNGFLRMIEEIIRRNGLPDAEIHMQRRAVTLPGYFRPTKLWDMLVLHGGQLVAAIELKSHIGPSFGNNFNNRTEEAIGTALDLWTAYREGAFGDIPRPFVGWLMLLEDCPGSRLPVRDRSPHFPVFPEFASASYAQRYDILCRKLVREQLYTTASLLLAARSSASHGKHAEVSELTGLRSFMAALAGHTAAEAARTK